MKLDRRNFLKGLGATTVALPLLGSLDAAAQAGAFPKRLLVFFSANGTVPFRWAPTGDENNWSFNANDILAPLERHKSDLLVLEGVDMVSTRFGIGDGHQKGMAHMLTGTELLPGPFQGGGDAGTAGYAGGISVDQHIANEVHAGQKFKSLELGVQCGNPTNWSRMSYAGPDQPVTPRMDPYEAFDAIFGDIGADPFGIEQLRARRQSVLDFVKSDLTKLQTKLSAEDRIRVEAHTEAIRSLEQRLLTGNELGIACEPPNQGAQIDAGSNDNFGAVGDLMTDLAVMSFACNLTPVASLQWSRSVSNINFGFAGVGVRHHDMSHESDSNTSAVENLVNINRWYAEKFALILDKLKAIPEGEGTLLDNTVVVWVNELGKGNSHTRNDVPYVLGGSCGGYFNTGRYLQYDADPHNNFLVSLCNAMGVQTNTFGNPNYCTGPLPNLT